MKEVPAALEDAAALTGGEALQAATLGGEMGALVDALRVRPAPPALVARGLDGWRPLETVTGQTVWLGRALEIPRPQSNAEPDMASADAADLLPLWDRAYLAWSERAGHVGADQLCTTTALTPLRALLVLESEQDYARFGLAAQEPASDPGHTREQGTAGGEQDKNVWILGVLKANEGSHIRIHLR